MHQPTPICHECDAPLVYEGDDPVRLEDGGLMFWEVWKCARCSTERGRTIHRLFAKSTGTSVA
jgi:RNase P subunit RPR2